ncbi:serpin family protein [Ereboglobus luteus]|uniref:Serpin domain-containing protein n=1 Tax=Ereboglobus luteus TaxID=1796921 RepID=A0A2U8E5R7_9BACT|nr:serpin family protein [Ereboglobus luteus]AWI10191.1 hypothetical protein CKA38_13825 [Ereboglobus luteus]
MKLHHLILNIAVGFTLTLAVSAERLPRSAAALASSSNDFACDLYAQLRDTEGNLFFSPFSVSSALAMTYAGAKGDTAAQMQKVLRFPDSQTETHSAFAALLKHFDGVNASGNVQLNIANSLWPQKGAPLLVDYLSLVRKNYGVEITPVDFVNDEPNARERINQWVGDATKGKITNIIDNPLPPHTRLVLSNAVYFKGKWRNPFEAADTRSEPFYTWNDADAQVPLMRQTDTFRYVRTKDSQIIELRYRGRTMSMLIVLPIDKSKQGLAEIEEKLSSAQIMEWRRQVKEQKVRLLMPRFKMNFGPSSLVKPLKSIGLRDAFNSRAADFSGMNGTKEIFISDIVQSAFVDVSEEGTEAAASSGLDVVLLGIDSRAGPPVFRADHPFIFLIQDNATGCILFMGRVVNPKE